MVRSIIDYSPSAEGEIRDAGGNSFRTRTLLRTVTQASAAAESTLGLKLPRNSHVECVKFKITGALTYSGGTAPVKLGIGTGASGNPDALYLSDTGTAVDTDTDTPKPLGTSMDNQTSDADVYVTACNTSGAADGNWVGTVVVEIIYREYFDADTGELIGA